MFLDNYGIIYYQRRQHVNAQDWQQVILVIAYTSFHLFQQRQF